MKKILSAVCLALLSCLMFVACTGAPAAGTETDTAAPEPGDEYVITLGSVTVRMHAEADDILSLLGAWQTREATGSCAFGGEDICYVYEHFILQTYEADGKEYVSLVSLSDDTYATPEGISIGSSVDAVRTAYGTPTSETVVAISYQKGNTRIQFNFREGSITNIQYLLVE